jgi:hypothetical protein
MCCLAAGGSARNGEDGRVSGKGFEPLTYNLHKKDYSADIYSEFDNLETKFRHFVRTYKVHHIESYRGRIETRHHPVRSTLILSPNLDLSVPAGLFYLVSLNEKITLRIMYRADLFPLYKIKFKMCPGRSGTKLCEFMLCKVWSAITL